MENAQNSWNHFIEEYGFNEEHFNVEFGRNRLYNTTSQIYQYAETKDVDLIVMGAQGKSALQRFTYGSVTEELVNICDDLPILIVR